MIDLQFPPGYIAGCLPRASNVGDVCARFSDEINVIPREQWPNHIAAGVPDLRPLVQHVKNQRSDGSCACEATFQGLEMTRHFQGASFVQFNPLFLYHFTHASRNGGGSNIDRNLEVCRDIGACPESVWPRSKGWRQAPPKEAMEAAKTNRIDEFFDVENTEDFGSALIKGFAVVFGYNPGGGHAVVATSIHSDREFEFCNSWGDWGDGGFGKLRFRDVDFGYGAFAIRSVITTAPE